MRSNWTAAKAARISSAPRPGSPGPSPSLERERGAPRPDPVARAGRPARPAPPPGPMPLRRDGQTRKRWRYVGVFGEELMLCAARAEVGPLGQSFWVMWDRQGRRHDARTTLRPGSREVPMDGPSLEIDSPGLRASLRLGEMRPDRIDLPQRLRLGLDPQARRGADRGHGRDPRQALGGRRPTASTTSPPATTSATPAGTGRPASAAPRRPRPRLEPGRGRQRPGREQRAGDLGRRRAHRAGPGLLPRHATASTSPTATASTSPPSPRHARDENFLLLRSRYRHRFGTFSGSLAGLAARRGPRRDGGARRRLVMRSTLRAYRGDRTLRCDTDGSRAQRYSGLGKSKRQPASQAVRWLPWAGMPPASLRIRARCSMFQAAKVVLRLVKSFSGPPEPSSR